MNISEIRKQYPQYADVSDAELARGLHRTYYSDMPYAQFLRQIDFGRPVDPTEDMSGAQKFLAGAGKAFYDTGRGIGQLTGLTDQASVDEAKSLDKPLMQTGAGLVGNIAGNAALFAPTSFVPGANTYAGAGLAGAAMGALQPTATGESRAMNTGFGAASGVAGQAIGRGLGRALRPVASRLNPEEAALAQAAAREGVPLTAGQATGSRPLQIAESVMENLPLTSEAQLAGREAQQRAFTAAALRRAGINATAATPEVLGSQKAALGRTFKAISERNSLDFSQGLADRLNAIAKDAETHLPPDEAAKIAATIKKIMSGSFPGAPEKVVASHILSESGQPFTKTIAAIPPAPMPGTLYQGWREPLRGLASEGGATGNVYSQIRSALDEAFRTQTTGIDGEIVRDAARKYANLKTLMQAAGGAGTPAATNQIAPAQLSAALRQSVGKEGVALGRGDLNELARIGTKFVRDQTANSGSAQRLLIQGLLMGGRPLAGAGVGGGTAMALGKDPWEGAAYGAAAGGAALLLPKVVQSLMNSPAGQAYLTKGAVPLTDAGRKALADTLRALTVGGTVSTQMQ